MNTHCDLHEDVKVVAGYSFAFAHLVLRGTVKSLPILYGVVQVYPVEAYQTSRDSKLRHSFVKLFHYRAIEYDLIINKYVIGVDLVILRIFLSKTPRADSAACDVSHASAADSKTSCMRVYYIWIFVARERALSIKCLLSPKKAYIRKHDSPLKIKADVIVH